MALYIVYRHGWDERNQPPEQGLPEKMAVLRLEAGSAEEASRKAAEQVRLGPKQYLTAELAGPVDALEGTLGMKPEALERAGE